MFGSLHVPAVQTELMAPAEYELKVNDAATSGAAYANLAPVRTIVRRDTFCLDNPVPASVAIPFTLRR